MSSLITIADLATSQIVELLDLATQLKEEPGDRAAGRLIVPMFFEPSTRTRMSFDIASARLGAKVIEFDPETSSAVKGESLRDTAQTVGALGPDLIIIRHPRAGAPEAVARWSGRPVINGGDGRRAHPTQTLADLLTMRDHFGDLNGLRVGIVGDIANSRVARGLLDSLPRFGAEITGIGPPGFVPRDLPWEMARTTDLDSKLGELDVVYLLRVQKERGGALAYPSDAEYHGRFGLSEERSQLMKPDCVVMHPGPINRGVEIAGSLVDSDRSLVLDQVSAGVHVRMAVIASIVEGLL